MHNSTMTYNSSIILKWMHTRIYVSLYYKKKYILCICIYIYVCVVKMSHVNIFQHVCENMLTSRGDDIVSSK